MAFANLRINEKTGPENPNLTPVAPAKGAAEVKKDAPAITQTTVTTPVTEPVAAVQPAVAASASIAEANTANTTTANTNPVAFVTAENSITKEAPKTVANTNPVAFVSAENNGTKEAPKTVANSVPTTSASTTDNKAPVQPADTVISPTIAQAATKNTSTISKTSATGAKKSKEAIKAEKKLLKAEKSTLKAKKKALKAEAKKKKATGPKAHWIKGLQLYKLIVTSMIGVASFATLYIILAFVAAPARIITYEPDAYPILDLSSFAYDRALTDKEKGAAFFALLEVGELSKLYAVLEYVSIAPPEDIANRSAAILQVEQRLESTRADVRAIIAKKLVLSDDHLVQVQQYGEEKEYTSGPKSKQDPLNIAYKATNEFLATTTEGLTNAYALYTLAAALEQDQSAQISAILSEKLGLQTTDEFALALAKYVKELEIDESVLTSYAAAPSEPEPIAEEPVIEEPIEEPSEPEPTTEEPIEEPSEPEPNEEEPTDEPMEEPTEEATGEIDPGANPPVDVPDPGANPPVEEFIDEPEFEDPMEEFVDEPIEKTIIEEVPTVDTSRLRPNQRFFRRCGSAGDDVTNGKFCSL